MNNTNVDKLIEIKEELMKARPDKTRAAKNRKLTQKEIIFTLAPALERMKLRGFDTDEIVEKLQKHGILIKPQTLTKYLSEFKKKKNAKSKTNIAMPVMPRQAETMQEATKDYQPQAEKPDEGFSARPEFNK